MIKAKAIMTENVATVKDSANAAEAARLLLKNKVSTLVVVDSKNRPVAIVTDDGLIKGTLKKSLQSVKVKDIMERDFGKIGPDEPYRKILARQKKGRISKFAVVSGNELKGLITETDIVEATKSFTRMHQIVQESILAVFGLVTAFFLFFFSPLGQSIRHSLP